jgi:hypothetical protein
LGSRSFATSVFHGGRLSASGRDRRHTPGDPAETPPHPGHEDSLTRLRVRIWAAGSIAQAVDREWSGTTSGRQAFGVADNWSPSGAPAAGDRAGIPLGGNGQHDRRRIQTNRLILTASTARLTIDNGTAAKRYWSVWVWHRGRIWLTCRYGRLILKG